MAKKKKTTKNKLHIKKNVRDLIIFLVIATILGLVFMNVAFTLIMLLGIVFILWLSTFFSKKKKKKWVRITINCFAILILLCAIAGVGAVAWFLNYVVENAPEFNEDALVMSQTTIVYDSSNKEMAELGTQKRENIEYDKLSEVLIDSLIATEDSRFFQHNGFDAPRFLIASIKQALGNDDAGGASTLTMQVAKNSYNAENATVTKGFAGIVRKFTDIYMAVFKIEEYYSKEDIIEFYVNNHFLGNNANGVEQAAQTYFGKHAYELNLSEASLIVGMFQAPTAYNPFKYPEKAAERRATVLNLMYKHGYISKEERDIANAVPVSSLLKATKAEQKYYSYLNTVVEEAIDKYGVNPHTSSMLIYTNMNSQYQQVIDDILSGKTYTWENPVVQAGIAVVDVKTGKILAIGAGRNQTGNLQFNYATSTKRQIGSTAKPIFDYAPGMEFKNWSTYTLFDDSKYYYSSGQEIRNSDRKHMGVITLRTALAESRNVPALKAFQAVDNRKIYDFVTSLGITLEPEAVRTKHLHEAHSIGSFNGSNPLEMAAAYAAFANGGIFYEPYTINKIVFRDTGEVLTHESEGKRVMRDSTAFMITDALKTAVNDGLSYVAKINGVNVAAKTGTTNHTAATVQSFGLPNSAINDAWVIGYDPNISIGIWYGYEPISREYYTTPITAAQQRKALFSAVGSKIFKKDGSDFKVPSSVIKVAVEFNDDVSKEPKLASEFTPAEKIRYEYFRKGTEPTEVSTAYQRLPDPTGLAVTYEPTTLSVNISWKAITTPTDIVSEYGTLGYRIYKDGQLIGFTTESTYKISNVVDPNGTYRVAAGYQDNQTLDSLGISKSLEYEDPNKYAADLLVPKSKTYHVGDVLDSYDANPGIGDVKVTNNGEAISNATIAISVTNVNGESIANVSTMEEDVFTITYHINYKNFTTTLKRTITIDAKVQEPTPTPTPTPTPEPEVKPDPTPTPPSEDTPDQGENPLPEQSQTQ